MPLADNTDSISFASVHPIDKIVQQGEVTIVNDGATSDYAKAKIVESTVTNSYGRMALVRARWSIDGGTNWQALDTEIIYSYDLTFYGVTLPGIDSAISIGTSDSTVYFRTANGKHGNVTDAGLTVYTPTSRTFTIQYALYERE